MKVNIFVIVSDEKSERFKIQGNRCSNAKSKG